MKGLAPSEVPEQLHVEFNALRESLESHPAWVNFDPIFRDIVVLLGEKKWRDRYVQKLMPAQPREKR